jgi:enoyl-CoA hydratase/carnithine racemase
LQLQDNLFAAYRSLKLTRDADGVLVVELHTKGGPFRFTAQDHTEFVDAFYRIAQDRENKIVILTGAGGEFIPETDFSSFGNVADVSVWSQIHDEGVQLLENIANIRVPVLAAIEGRAHVHSEYALLANIIVAGEGATFHDAPHFAGGLCRATEPLPRGVIALERGERKRSCSTHSRSRRKPRTNGEGLPRLCRTVRRCPELGNWPSCT